MEFCKHRVMDKCKKDDRPCIFSKECFEPEDVKQQSNAERIRSMSDEELAESIYNGISSDACDYCKHNNLHCDGSPCRGKAHTEIIVEWLQQIAEECI